MKNLLIICLSLTVGCLGLLGMMTGRAAARSSAPDNLSAGLPAHLSVPHPAGADSLDVPAMVPAEAILPLDSGATEPQTRAPMIALTFDDGPSAEYTPRLLDGLAERGVRVTFFVVGTRVEKSPEIVLRAYEEGHVIGGHSYDHNNRLTMLSKADLNKQVNVTADMIGRITESPPPALLRPPYGAINETTAAQTGKANIMWNIDPRDWDVRDTEKVRAHIVEQAMDGGVVILHDIVGSSVDAALLAIDDLQADGWVFVTVPELYAAFGIDLEAGGIYRGPESYITPK